MSRAPKCPSCGRPLEQGVLLDHDHGTKRPVSWLAGPAEKSFWGGIKSRNRTIFAVYAMRCTGCGLLQLVAPGEPPAA